MKLVKVLPMLAVASFCLMGCQSKCDYAKFHEQATSVKTHSYKKASVKVDGKEQLTGLAIAGTVKYIYNGGWELDANDNNGVAVKTAASLYIASTAAIVAEDDNLEYYAGGGFKVVEKDSKNTTQFNSYGLLTSYKSENMKVSISYSK